MKLVSSFRLIAMPASLFMASMAVMASDDPRQPTLRDIVTQQYQLRQQVVAGKGAFEDMSEAQRRALAERQHRVLRMLDGSQTLDEMPPDQRVVVFNDPVNLMSYVVMVFKKVFGFDETTARKHMLEVHEQGRSVVWAGVREQAEAYVFTLQQWHLNAVLEGEES